MRANRRRTGTALIDVLVALVILGTSGVALITLLGQTAHSMRHVRDTERDVRLASAELDRFVAIDRTQLVAMIGRSSQRGWTIDISQPAPDLFDVSIAHDSAGGALLHTSFYRPDTTNATQQ